MSNGKTRSLLDRLGYAVSSWVSDLAASPLAQIGIILICVAWFVVGFATDVLTAILSIMAITLTQMVLNRQKEREADAHRRDVAMHAKIDELVIAVQGARNEMAGIEELEEEDIEDLKGEVKEAIDRAGDDLGPREREAAKQVAANAVEDEVSKARASKARKRAPQAGRSGRR